MILLRSKLKLLWYCGPESNCLILLWFRFDNSIGPEVIIELPDGCCRPRMITKLIWSMAFPWFLDSPGLRLWVGWHFHGYWTLLNSGCELAGISMVTGLPWAHAELTGISMAPTITVGLDPGPGGWKENWPHLIWRLFGLGGVVALSTHRTNVDTVYYWEGFWAHGHSLAELAHIQRQSYTFRDCSTCSMRLWWSPTALVLFTMLA